MSTKIKPITKLIFKCFNCEQEVDAFEPVSDISKYKNPAPNAFMCTKKDCFSVMCFICWRKTTICNKHSQK